MSAAKHQPATPLPWNMSGPVGSLKAHTITAGGRHVATTWRDTIKDGEPVTPLNAEQNAAYLVHAANAYPKLVEALRLVANGMVDRATLCKESAALLRELGEAS